MSLRSRIIVFWTFAVVYAIYAGFLLATGNRVGGGIFCMYSSISLVFATRLHDRMKNERDGRRDR